MLPSCHSSPSYNFRTPAFYYFIPPRELSTCTHVHGTSALHFIQNAHTLSCDPMLCSSCCRCMPLSVPSLYCNQMHACTKGHCNPLMGCQGGNVSDSKCPRSPGEQVQPLCVFMRIKAILSGSDSIRHATTSCASQSHEHTADCCHALNMVT